MNGRNEFESFGGSGDVAPVVETIAAGLLTPLAVYLKLARDGGNSFLLESVEGGESLARYSFVGVNPAFTVSGGSERVIVRDGEAAAVIEIPMLEFLRDHFRKYRLQDVDGLPSFAGGAIGSLGFACAAWFEPVLQKSVAGRQDDAEFMFCRQMVAFDHAKQVIKIVSLVFTDEADGDPDRLRDMHAAAHKANRRLRETLEAETTRLPAPMPYDGMTEIVSNFAKSDFESAVRSVKEYIAAGDAYQVVLSQCFSRRTAATAVSIYSAMRSLNPSPYMFLINLNGRSIIGASPEMLVRARGGQLAKYCISSNC